MLALGPIMIVLTHREGQTVPSCQNDLSDKIIFARGDENFLSFLIETKQLFCWTDFIMRLTSFSK